MQTGRLASAIILIRAAAAEREQYREQRQYQKLIEKEAAERAQHELKETQLEVRHR